MQIVMTFNFSDDEYYFNTPDTQADSEANPYGKYQAVYYDGIHYYVNFDDDTDRQGGTLTMGLQLWHIGHDLGTWDTLVLDSSDTYTIEDPDEPYDTLHAECTGIFGYTNEVDVKVKTVQIDRCNTIAVYEANSTFNGHYNDKDQRFNVIQLHIPDEGHYLGTESFNQEIIRTNSTDIEFVTTDSSGEDGCVVIDTDIDEHTHVLRVEEQSDDDHANFEHEFDSSKSSGKIEWWWRSTKPSGGILYFYLKDGSNDAIKLFIRDGKIRYHDGSYHDVMSANANQWYRMRIDFWAKIGVDGIYEFDLYVDGVQKVNDGSFCSYRDTIDRIRIFTNGDTFNGYFDAFGFSWDSEYSLGDNDKTYDCDGTPFFNGPNVIIIPTELFTRTELHHYVENEQLEDAVLYSDKDHLFELISIERDGKPDTACGDVDYMFIRYEISPDDAMEVLNMVLKGLVEETLDEYNNTVYVNGTINSYICSKFNGTRANELNLPYGIIGYVPWFTNYTNSAMGPQPYTADPLEMFLWWITWIVPILHVIVLVHMAMVAAERTGYTLAFAAVIFMQLLTFIGDIIWVIIKTAVLILAWLNFAFKLLLANILLIACIGIVFFLSLFMNLQITIEYNEVLAEGDLYLIAGYNMSLEYIAFFELHLPAIDIYFGTDNFGVNYYSCFFDDNLTITEFYIGIFSNITGNNPNSSSLPKTSSEKPKISGGVNVGKYIINLITFAGIGMGLAGGFCALYASILTFMKDKTRSKLATIITLLIYLASIIILIALVEKTQSVIFGLALGFLIAGIYLFKTMFDILETHYMENFILKYGKFASDSTSRWELYKAADFFFSKLEILDALFGIASLSVDLEDLFSSTDEDTQWPLSMLLADIGGVVALLVAKYALILFPGHYKGAHGQPAGNMMAGKNKQGKYLKGFTKDDKALITGMFAIGTIIISLILFAYGKDLPSQ